MAVKPHAIDVDIEELVLHGFALGDRDRIGEALQRELTRLFVVEGVPLTLARDFEIDHRDAGPFRSARDSKPEATGSRVARSVYTGLSKW